MSAITLNPSTHARTHLLLNQTVLLIPAHMHALTCCWTKQCFKGSQSQHTCTHSPVVGPYSASAIALNPSTHARTHLLLNQTVLQRLEGRLEPFPSPEFNRSHERDCTSASPALTRYDLYVYTHVCICNPFLILQRMSKRLARAHPLSLYMSSAYTCSALL